jgi:hypothetical protein
VASDKVGDANGFLECIPGGIPLLLVAFNPGTHFRVQGLAGGDEKLAAGPDVIRPFQSGPALAAAAASYEKFYHIIIQVAINVIIKFNIKYFIFPSKR